MKHALRFLARRFAWALVLVLGVTSLSFVVVQVLPGDPTRMLLGPQASLRARSRHLTYFRRSVKVQGSLEATLGTVYDFPDVAPYMPS